MPLSDTSITMWENDYLTSDTNSPADSDYIATMLDDQARNVKSVARAEAENKAWVRLGEVATYVSATSFTLVGDQRAVASIGRRVKASITGATRYGTIRNSTFASNTTTVTVQWDLEHYTTHALTVATPNSISFVGSGDIRSRFAVDEIHEFWAVTTGARKVRKVSALSFGGGATGITYVSGDPYIGLDANDDDLLIPSQGIDNTLTEVQLGIFTPDQFQSGMQHAFLAGQFTVGLDGSNGPFVVNLPVRMPDALYKVAVTPNGIVTGTPTDSQWTKVYVSATAETNFSVEFPPGTTPDSATVRYEYVLWRQ